VIFAVARSAGMDFHEFMAQVHAQLQPDTYLEIGVRHGESLALAKCPSVGVDPAFDLTLQLDPSVSLFEQTSDEYFRRAEPLAPFGGRPITLALIDGMHLVEYVLRDFINVECRARWSSVVVIDDVLPRRSIEAARERKTRFWTGDVYKIARVLERRRPDLACIKVDTEPTGVLVILGLDPDSSVLDERFDKLAPRAIKANARGVPRRVLKRNGALSPEAMLAAPFWSLLRDQAVRELPREQGLPQLRERLRSDDARL
jgi:hypothetical protein